MIHFLTIHFNTDKWIDIQYENIKKNFNNSKIYYLLCNIDTNIINSGTIVGNIKQPIPRTTREERAYHYRNLSILLDYMFVNNELKHDDTICIIDGDCFPIANEYVFNEYKEGEEVVSIIRPEIGYIDKVDFIFTMFSVDMLRQSYCPFNGEESVSDFKKYLIGRRLKHIRRTESLLEEKSILFGVYGNLIYHHGCGFRGVFHEAEDGDSEFYKSERVIKKLKENKELSDNIYIEIKSLYGSI